MTINNTRRSLLASIAAMSAAGLAGCSNNPASNGNNSDTTEGSNQPSEFESIEGEGTELTVTLSDREIADTLQLNYEGEKFATTDVSNAKTGTFDIGVNYTPGEHDLLALKNGDVISETTINLEPDLELVDIGLGKSNPDKFGDVHHAYGRLYFTVTNSGNASDQANKLLSPDTPKRLTDEAETPGFVTEEEPVASPTIPAGETRTFYSRILLWSAASAGSWNCGNEYSMEIQIEWKHSDQTEKQLSFGSTMTTQEYDSIDEPKVYDDVCELTKLTEAD